MKWPLWKIQFGQLDENKIIHTCVCIQKFIKSIK